MLLVIALGGMLGSLARLGVAEALPNRADAFPWSTFLINIGGCLLIGLLMVYVVEVGAASRYVRPFLGVGVLGGFTTFSTYALDSHQLWMTGRHGTAIIYIGATLVGALLAVQAGVGLGRLIFRTRGA